MVTLDISLDALLQANEKGREEQKLELEVDVPFQQPAEIQDTNVMGVHQIASRYRVSLKEPIYSLVEKMCNHVRSLGYDKVMVQIGVFPRREWWDEKTPIHTDFLGLEAIADTYEFRDFILDMEGTMRVKTDSFTHYNAEFGPHNNVLSPDELFEIGVGGYSVSASITDRSDGGAAGEIVIHSKDRKIAREVHDEVLNELRILYQGDPLIENASTKALDQVCKYSKHKHLLRFHPYGV